MGNLVTITDNAETDVGLVGDEAAQQTLYYAPQPGLTQLQPSPKQQIQQPQTVAFDAPVSSSEGGNDPWRSLPLHHAVATGAASSELNRLVVHEGCDVDQQDATGSTPLHLACYFGHEHCARWLANRGRARYLKDLDGNTPAEVARQNGNMRLAELVEEKMTEGGLANARWGSRRAAEEKKEEQLYVELDRMQSRLSQLQASEKRARAELEREVAERVKLFRRVVSSTIDSTSESSALDLVGDLRLQIAEFKAQRDALSAELGLVNSAVSDLEMLLGSAADHESKRGGAAQQYETPSARLRACLRKI